MGKVVRSKNEQACDQGDRVSTRGWVVNHDPTAFSDQPRGICFLPSVQGYRPQRRTYLLSVSGDGGLGTSLAFLEGLLSLRTLIEPVELREVKEYLDGLA